MSSHEQNLTRLRAVARVLRSRLNSIVFTGGATISLYVDDPLIQDPRPTDDIDVVVELSTYVDFVDFESFLRSVGFKNDITSPIISRYSLRGIVLDIIPTSDILGFANPWHKSGMANTIEIKVSPGMTISIFQAPYYLAAKLEALSSRGKDLRTSTDFEDIVYLLAYRPSLTTEVVSANSDVRSFIASRCKELIVEGNLYEAIYAHLEPEFASELAPRCLEAVNELSQYKEM